MLESLFAKIADKIISSIAAQLDPTDKVKKWLGLEPATLAYQKALSRAYSAFARQYPEYTTSLFDLTFLTEAGAPELSKLLTRHFHPDPALFAQAWSNSIGLSETSAFRTEAVKPASDFLKWLEAELKSESVFRPIFDSRALETLPELENQLEKLTAELKRGFDAALKTAKEYEKITLEIGGDIKDSNVVIGDHNQVTVSNVYNHYHTGAFTTLSDYYISPDAVFQRVHVDQFVGRDWLTAKVDAFLNDPRQKSGIVLLIGEAGVGKTSFMAHLVKERRYLHLFAEQAPGDANLPRALQSLGSQLVTRYQIDSYKDRDTLTQLSVFPDFLDKLLRLAANTLTHDEKIVIVCDALDEAGTAAKGNVFGLPKVLPDNVYLILSQRPVSTKLPNLTPHKIYLEAQGSENLHDMQDYLKAVSKRAEIAGQLRSKNYSDEFFVETLQKKSLGVWMYLHYVIEEIAKGSRAPLDFDELPSGLAGYYADYWGDWREGRNGRGKGIEQWDALYTPLLTTLAVAQQPITLAQLMAWSGVTTTELEVTRLLQEQWRSFLTITESPQGELYRPYHASFRDFLTGKVDIDQLRPGEDALVKELAKQSVEAHKRIVEIFRAECNGAWEKLVEQEYPRLHLATHLAGARDFTALTNLLTEGDKNIAWAEARYQKEETYAGYLNDLVHIWKYGEEKGDYALLIRCVLTENSIRSLAKNIQPELLAELAETGLWGYPRCLTTISQMPDAYQQAEAIQLIAPSLPKTLWERLLGLAREIKNETFRDSALISLAPHLPDELKLQLLSAVCEIKNEYYRANALISLAPHIPDELKLQLLSAVREIKDENLCGTTFYEIAPHLNDELQPLVLSEALSALDPDIDDELKQLALSEALSAIRETKNEYYRASTFPKIARQRNDELKAQMLSKDPFVAREINDEYHRASSFTKIAQHLNDELKLQVLSEALSTAREIKNDDRAYALAILAPHLNDELKLQVLSEALSSMHEIKTEFTPARARAFSALAPQLTNELKLQLLSAAREIKDACDRADSFAALAPYINNELKLQVLSEAVTATRFIQDESDRADAFAALAPHLTDELRLQLLSAARKIQDGLARARAFAALAPHLTDELKLSILSEALSAAREYQSEYGRADAFAALAPHLTDELRLQLLSAAREIKNEYARASAFSALAPHLTNELKLQLLSAAREIRAESDRASAFAALAPHLTEELKLTVLSEALSAAREIKNDNRDRAFFALAPHLTGDIKVESLIEALFGIQSSFKIEQVVEEWKTVDYDGFEKKAFEFLRSVSSKDRGQGISTLSAILPALQHIAGEKITGEMLRAIRETARWWP